MSKFKVIIAGSRKFNDYEFLKQKCDFLLKEKSKTHQIVIIEGEASGADLLGKRYAKEKGYEVDENPAKWQDFSEPCVVKTNKRGEKYNALAGHKRNEVMAKKADALIAFNLNTPGTNNMIKLAKKHGLLIREFKF